MLSFSGGNYTLQNNQKSIHIVIFTGGLYPLPEKTVSYWKNPLHGQPELVIAADSGLEACLKYNSYFEGLYDFLPKKILGDFDSISDKSLLADYADVTETFPADKDFSDTELALHRAYGMAREAGKTPFITLVGGDGGRMDHLLNNYYSFAAEEHPDVWLGSFQSVYFLKKKPYFVTVSCEKDCISFGNVLGKTSRIKTQGLEWESELFRKSPFPSLSNRVKKSYFEEKRPVKVIPKALGYILIGPLDMTVIPTAL